MNPDGQLTWKYWAPRPPICQNCGVPMSIKSKQTASDFLFGCVSCGTEATDRITDRITKTKTTSASAPSNNR